MFNFQIKEKVILNDGKKYTILIWWPGAIYYGDALIQPSEDHFGYLVRRFTDNLIFNSYIAIDRFKDHDSLLNYIILDANRHLEIRMKAQELKVNRVKRVKKLLEL